MDERTQFTFYASFFDAVSRIKKKADRADAYDAICAYALREEDPDFSKMSDAAQIAFLLIKPNLDSSRRKAKGKTVEVEKQEASKTEANKKQTASKMNAKARKRRRKRKRERKRTNVIPLTPLRGEAKRKSDSPRLRWSRWRSIARERGTTLTRKPL